jgi:hypothetical protein
MPSGESSPRCLRRGQEYRRRIFMWLRIDRDKRRVWIFGCRVHHGQLGLFLIGLGLMLTAHDWHDFRAGFPS